jgi:hypothetical protein
LEAEMEQEQEPQEKKPCEHCGAEDAEYARNPYDYDVNNVEVWEWMCDDCYDNSCGDI